MDSRLFMEIGVENTTFQAIDKTPYERWINDGILDGDHVVLQRLNYAKDTDNSEIKDYMFAEANSADQLRNSWEVEDIIDGLYYYQKLILPTVNHSSGANEAIWYENGVVKYYDSDEGIVRTYDMWDDFDTIFELIRGELLDNCFYFDDYTFTMFSLVECYILTERERLNNYLKNNCREVCKTNSTLTSNADILLAAITIINGLIAKHDYFEALHVLNGLNTCKGLCPNRKINLKNCGCGGVL